MEGEVAGVTRVIFATNPSKTIVNSVEFVKDRVWNYYDLLEKLGEGNYGTVYSCRHIETGVIQAAKSMPVFDTVVRKQIENEIAIMCLLKHSNIVDLASVYSSHGEVTLVMELIEGGELLSRITSASFDLTELKVSRIIAQVCEAMRFIHSKSIVHLDLKPENILCADATGGHIKLIDFGFAQQYNPLKPLRIIAGSSEFIAPEVISYEVIDYRADIWSLGVITYLLLLGVSPFLGRSPFETFSNVTKGQWAFVQPNGICEISQLAVDFISHLLVYDKRNRFNSVDCLEHKWIAFGPTDSAIQQASLKLRLRKYLAKRRWKTAVHAVVFLRRSGWKFQQ